MAITDQAVTEIPEKLISQVDWLVTLLQALGIFVILYVIFNLINIFLNRKKNKQLKEINENILDIKKLLKKK